MQSKRCPGPGFVNYEHTEAIVMRQVPQVSGVATSLNRQDVKDIIGLKNFYHAVYNPTLFTQLQLYRTNLDKEYFALLEAFDNNQQLKLRNLFFQFNDTLSRYLNKNRVELYGYLGNLYKDDDEKMIAIEANRGAMNAAIDAITRTMVKYVSPSANYDKKFRRDLNSIWVILKWRYYKENKQLYQLYPKMVETTLLGQFN